MAIEVGDILRLTVEMTMLGTEQNVNVHHFEVTTNTTVDDAEFMTDMAGYLESAYSNIAPRMTTSLTFDSVRGQNITQDLLLPSTAFGTLAAGSDVSDPLPPQVAILVYLPTARPKTRASIYVPGICEASIGATAAMSSAAQDDFETFGDDFVGEQGTLDAKVRRIAYNRTLDRATRVTSRVVPIRPRTQRRRRPGVGV